LILAVSEVTRRQLVEDLGVRADKVVVAHTGVPSEFFIEDKSSHDELRLLFLGSLSTEKDPQLAIDVAVGLRRDHRVRLRIVGDGPLAPDLAVRVDGEALGEIVKLTGPVDDVTPHLAWADVLILTSRTEGLPGAVLEAGAAGVPTVGFNVGGTAETMQPGVSGVLVDPGDVGGMIATIDGIARNPDELKRLGTTARQFVGEHYTLERSIRRYDSVLSELLAAGGA
jgi:glycosyltransferase involved in cell wall biosynthesis